MAKKKIYKHHQRTTAALAQADAQPRELVLSSDNCQAAIKFQNGSVLVLNNWVDPKSFGAKGDGVTDDTNAMLACWNAAVECKTVLIPKGRYMVQPDALNWGTRQDYVFMGCGIDSEIRAITSGSYIMNLGSYNDGTETIDLAARRNHFSNFYLTSAGTVQTGIRSVWGVENSWHGVHVISDSIMRALDIEFSWTNKWTKCSFQAPNTLTMGFTNVNLNQWDSCRFRASSPTSGTNVIARGQGNGFNDCDLSNGLYNLALGRTRGLTVKGGYMEGGALTRNVCYGVTGETSDAVSLQGIYIAGGTRGIGYLDDNEHDGLSVHGCYFKDLEVGIDNHAAILNQDFGANKFDTVTTKYAYEFPHWSGYKGANFTQAYNIRTKACNLGDTSLLTDVPIDSVTNLTGGKPANLTIKAEGRDNNSTTKLFTVEVGINDDGSLSHWAITSSNGDHITGMDVSSGTLRFNGMAVSNWNAQITSGLWED